MEGDNHRDAIKVTSRSKLPLTTPTKTEQVVEVPHLSRGSGSQQHQEPHLILSEKQAESTISWVVMSLGLLSACSFALTFLTHLTNPRDAGFCFFLWFAVFLTIAAITVHVSPSRGAFCFGMLPAFALACTITLATMIVLRPPAVRDASSFDPPSLPHLSVRPNSDRNVRFQRPVRIWIQLTFVDDQGHESAPSPLAYAYVTADEELVVHAPSDPNRHQFSRGWYLYAASGEPQPSPDAMHRQGNLYESWSSATLRQAPSAFGSNLAGKR